MAAQDFADVQLLDEVRRIEALSRAAVGGCLPAHLTGPQFDVLNLLSRRGDGVTPAEIARALSTTRNGLTNTLQRLEAQGLIAVAGCPADGRRKRIAITAEGRAAYADVMKGLRPRIEGLRAAFKPDEFAAALPFLRSLRAWLDAEPAAA